MDWLMDNPLADMYGPLFLLVYAGVIALTVVACRLLTRSFDWTAGMPLPPIPSNPDPHEIAYLRGGENEVTRSVVFALVQRGQLRMAQQGAEQVIEQGPNAGERQHLSPIERRTLDWFTSPRKASDLFKATGLSPHLKPFCSAYEHHLQKENLLTAHDARQTARLVVFAGASVIFGLGAYKFIVAVAEGRYNVSFLVILGIIGLTVLVKACRVPRVSRRGRTYLERLQLAFERLKYKPALTPEAVGNSMGVTAPAYAFDPSLLLLVGVFGVGALAGTPYDYYQQSFQRAAMTGDGGVSSASSCGSSCGSSDSSSSGSDGGSSCSSGSSCGSSCGGGCGG